MFPKSFKQKQKVALEYILLSHNFNTEDIIMTEYPMYESAMQILHVINWLFIVNKQLLRKQRNHFLSFLKYCESYELR